jgi:hypothetical protein
MHYDNYVVTLSLQCFTDTNLQNQVSDRYRKYHFPLHLATHTYRKVRFLGHVVYHMYRKCHFIGHVILGWTDFSRSKQQGRVYGFCS